MEKNNSHLAGEYFVAAELYRRGFSIGMTIGNAKAIDLFANKDTKTIAIQVKAIKNKKSVGWPLMTDKILDNIVYVFVNLNEFNAPEYYICTSKEVREKIKQYSTRGIVMLTSLKDKKYIDRWDKIRL